MSSAETFLSSIFPLLVSLNVIGVSDYTRDSTKTRLKRSKLLTIYMRIKSSLVCVLVICGSFYGQIFKAETVMELLIYNVMNYGNLFYVFTVYILITWNFKKIVPFFDDFVKIDTELEWLLMKPVDYKTTIKSIYLYFAVSYAMTFVVLIVHVVIGTGLWDFIAYLIGILVGISMESTLFSILRELRRRYELINECLINLSSKQFEDAFDRLKRLKLVYLKLLQFRKILGDFALQFLIKFCMSYLLFLSGLYNFYVLGFNNWFSHLVILLWSSKEILGAIYYFDSVTQEVLKTRVLYEAAMKTYDLNYRRRGLFHLQVQFENNCFWICGLFPMKWSLALSMIGSIVSNLVILIQFKKMTNH
ncbi:PREDICTED: uncharacterized protein LOC108559798 [Nicrophorus vespilloides]|uniref:Gustatory receptor n=1 Tax=Nicrophorus vespilloides TaxID=110193 RepID=A0ABM1MDJ3_NICVS|nr:PREDICTED: uncharacterized protein LOC108559798 [Nicrophorus vespilloides]